eukprot:gnl/MRDRNA2_/MRDRNA2_88418_c0_seq1.p1 gnl/MRDRNA2_/MRDRNA2_88418_c0~~gnl/MRDRNA2_/MRDRNA2_88418_c0_seq1.p1  ORF type:complete len:223 (+),score=75.47 gnl/MRDRNA2_/MRDRNA2_88418_c0_seq1:101-769(+)
MLGGHTGSTHNMPPREEEEPLMFSSTGGTSKPKANPKKDNFNKDAFKDKDDKKQFNPLEMMSPKSKMLVLAILMGLVMIIHILPVGDSFFQKIGSIRRFVHGDLTREVSTWKKQNEDLKKQLEDSQALARSLRTSKTSEEKVEEAKRKQLEQKMKVSEEDWKAKENSAEESEKKAENRADEMERKMNAMQSQLTEAQQRGEAAKTKLDKLKQKEMDLLKDFS